VVRKNNTMKKDLERSGGKIKTEMGDVSRFTAKTSRLKKKGVRIKRLVWCTMRAWYTKWKGKRLRRDERVEEKRTYRL